jgi:DNA-binding MarR family transcriptional regulator
MIIHAQHSNPEGLKSSEIGHHFHMSRPAVSQMLSSLEKKGFIERTICPEDRRVIYVRLKPEAKSRFESYGEEIMKRVDDIFEELSEEEIQQVITLSDRLYSSLLRIHEKYKSQSWKPDCNHTKEGPHIS